MAEASLVQAITSSQLPAPIRAYLHDTNVNIPPYPAVASALERLQRDGRITVAQVSSMIATDAALAACVLRRAASAAVRGATTTTLEAAIWRLGFDEVIRLVMAVSIGAGAMAPGPLATLRRDRWRRSLLAATFCRELASERGVLPGDAFLAGLLHDFGAVVVLAVLESLPPVAEVERLVDDLHVTFGNLVAARWKLPEPLNEVIAHHHDPDACGRESRPLVALTATVDHIIDVLDRHPHGTAALGVSVGLSPVEQRKIEAALAKLGEIMAAFEVAETAKPAPTTEPPPVALENGWRVDFVVESRGGVENRAVGLAPNEVAFRGPVAMQPGWLAEIVLRCDPQPFTILANVRSCERLGLNAHLTIAQPFGLGGAETIAWKRLLDATRPIR